MRVTQVQRSQLRLGGCGERFVGIIPELPQSAQRMRGARPAHLHQISRVGVGLQPDPHRFEARRDSTRRDLFFIRVLGGVRRQRPSRPTGAVSAHPQLCTSSDASWILLLAPNPNDESPRPQLIPKAEDTLSLIRKGDLPLIPKVAVSSLDPKINKSFCDCPAEEARLGG